jgi:hypothetical protein
MTDLSDNRITMQPTSKHVPDARGAMQPPLPRVPSRRSSLRTTSSGALAAYWLGEHDMLRWECISRSTLSSATTRSSEHHHGTGFSEHHHGTGSFRPFSRRHIQRSALNAARELPSIKNSYQFLSLETDSTRWDHCPITHTTHFPYSFYQSFRVRVL